MVDFSQLDLDKDALVNELAYKYAESPSTQQFMGAAAQNLPNYAMALGISSNMRDINRANFNLGMQALAQTNAKKRQNELLAREDRIRKEGQDFQINMQQLADKNARQRAADQIQAQKDLYKWQKDQIAAENLRNFKSKYQKLNPVMNYDGTVNIGSQKAVDEWNNYLDQQLEAQKLGDAYKVDEIEKILDKLHDKYELFSPMSNDREKYNGIDEVSRLSGEVSKIGNAILDYTPEQQSLIKKGIFNQTPLKNTGFFEKIWNPDIALTRQKLIDSTMVRHKVGVTNWDNNDISRKIAKQILASPTTQEYLGTHNINNMVLLSNPYVASNKGSFFVVNKKDNKLYQLKLDQNYNVEDVESMNSIWDRPFNI